MIKILPEAAVHHRQMEQQQAPKEREPRRGGRFGKKLVQNTTQSQINKSVVVNQIPTQIDPNPVIPYLDHAIPKKPIEEKLDRVGDTVETEDDDGFCNKIVDQVSRKWKYIDDEPDRFPKPFKREGQGGKVESYERGADELSLQ